MRLRSLCTLCSALAAPCAHAAQAAKTIARELRQAPRAGAIDQATYDADRAIHADVKRTFRA